MHRPLIQAALAIAALTLAACGSDTAATPTPDQSPGIAVGEPSGGDSGPAELTTRLWIKPDLVDCIGEMTQKCMQIAETEDGEYLYFYDQIDGFTFVEGTSYVIDVRIEEVEDPPADASSLAYSLVQVVEEK